MPPGAKPTPDANALLAAAGAVLQRDGLDGLTVRAVAKQADTTTMTIYSRLGGKDGILDAVHREGFALLMEAFKHALEMAPERPENRIAVLCRTLRSFARKCPDHYRVMLGTPPDGYRPNSDAARRAQAAWAVLRTEVEPLVGPTSASADTYMLFALCHGLIELERGPLVALAPDPQQVFNTSLGAALRGLQTRTAGPSKAHGAIPSPPVEEDRIEFGDPSFREETPRNAPCPCGSGKRYKHCHGAAAA